MRFEDFEDSALALAGPGSRQLKRTTALTLASFKMSDEISTEKDLILAPSSFAMILRMSSGSTS